MQETKATPVLTGIGQVHISAKNFDRALGFYRDVLELPLLFTVPEQKMAFFDCGGVRLYLGVPSSPDYAANSFLYYTVVGIEAAHKRLEANGVAFLHPPHAVHRTEKSELWMAGFQDSEGNYAQLMEEKAL